MAVVLDELQVVLADRLAGVDDGVVALAHRDRREVGVAAGAVPVALLGLGGEADDDVVVLGDAVQQPAGDVHLVADGGRAERADLELPLAGHDLGVGAGDLEAGVEAGLRVLLDDLATDDAAGADAAVVRALRLGKPPPSGKPSGVPSGRSIVYSCSRPNHMSWSAYFFSAAAAIERVLVGCGFMFDASSTSHITRMLRPPRIGSGQVKTGLSTQSDLSPVAWLVDEPSKPQIGGVVTSSSMILVLLRSSAVGSVPSSQMYSAWYATSGSFQRMMTGCRGVGTMSTGDCPAVFGM